MSRLTPVLFALALAGCATAGGSGPPAPSADVLAQIQALTVTWCGYRPVINTVAQILASFGGAGAVAGEALVEKIAQGICAAVAPNPQLRSIRRTAVYHGVPIHGHWVRHP